MLRLQRAGAGAAAAVVLAWTSLAGAQGEIRPVASYPAPEQNEVESTPSAGLIVGGGLVFAAAYATALVGGLQSESRADRWLAVPLAGSWVALAEREECGLGRKQGGCDRVPLDQLGLIATGGFQAFGAAMILIGAATSELKPKQETARVARVQVMPAVGPSSYGLAAFGQF